MKTKKLHIRLLDALIMAVFIFVVLCYIYMVVNGIFFPDFG